ncbi:hypothetical protein IJJ12_02985, partial [bacterium]|nr:hypothetical protein [bacterium]
TLTYAAALKILSDRQYGATQHWDEVSLSPYLVYRASNDDGENRCHIGFFENERSLAYKMDVVAKLNLGGIAIWSLGYEGHSTTLWETISQRF